MYLFDKKENNIDIYSFEPVRSDLVEYRARLLQQKNRRDLFYRFETTKGSLKDRFLKGDELDIRCLQRDDTSRDASGWWSTLGKDSYASTYPYKSKEILQQELLQRYIDGDFSKNLPVRTFELIAQDDLACYINNFLVTTPPTELYSNVEKRCYYSFENIIDLPTELCILQLLENGQFSHAFASGLNLREQLELFRIKLLDAVNAKEMEKMIEYGLLDGNYNSVMRTVSNTQKILAMRK